MIASYTHNFIFIKTCKTASSSIEIAMSPWCAGRDIVTRMAPEDEILRAQYGGVPRNFCRSDELATAHLAALQTRDVDTIFRSCKRIKDDLTFGSHTAAKNARDELPDLWGRAFKFTVSRHPYEVVVSMAYWKLGRKHGGDAAKWPQVLEQVIASNGYLNHKKYTKRDEVLVDEVVPFTQVWPWLARFADGLGQTMQDPPHAKASYRLDRRPATEILTEAQKATIYERCRPEFELLDYAR